MTIEQLKSHAYDCLVNIEIWQKELQATNKKIAELSQVKDKEALKKNDKKSK